MKYKYCTLFDKNYLPHVLSLCESLDKHTESYVIYCFCMDDESFQYMEAAVNESIVPISYNQLEIQFPELRIAKANRSTVEYYFTCSSAICSYIFDNYPQTNLVTYLDADLYFFASPLPIYQELQDSSIGIIEHRFSFFGKRYEKYGKYNVGWISFKNDYSGRKCLEEWRLDCLDWCYDRLEDGKFADQKYLDYWSEKYDGVHVIQHLGANVAPWNVGQYKIKLVSATNEILVKNHALIFYHFSSLKQISENTYSTHVSQYLFRLSKNLKNNIYLPYLESLRKHTDEVGIKFIFRNRKDNRSQGFIRRFKHLSRRFRQVMCSDYLKFD
jgi:hypothetical protein